MDQATRVQIVDRAHCISQNTNALRKGINLTILPAAVGE